MIAVCGKKASFTFAISIRKILARGCKQIKNKEWNAEEKPEEKSRRRTLTYFNVTIFFKKMTLLLSAASFIVMPWCS